MNKKTIVIIGSGLAGTEIANTLDKNLFRVIVLEKGNYKTKPDSDFKFLNRSFGALPSRSINVGGTTAIWHGALMPISKNELYLSNQNSLPINELSILSMQKMILKESFKGSNFRSSNGNIAEAIDSLIYIVQMVVPRQRQSSLLDKGIKFYLNVDKIKLDFIKDTIKSISFENDNGKITIN